MTFAALAKPSLKDRKRRLKETLRAAKLRMSDIKASWLSENFDRISKMGGPASAKQLLVNERGPEAKREFLKSFDGIGRKYSRNMLMDVYHPDFRESIAVDVRILSISEKLGLSFKNYREHERFYVSVAHDTYPQHHRAETSGIQSRASWKKRLRKSSIGRSPS